MPPATSAGTVWVRADSRMLRLYHEGQPMKAHARQRPGGRATDHDDYPPELTGYTLRDPKRLIRQAKKHGLEIGRFAESLLSGALPWARLRQAQKLLRLAQKYGGHASTSLAAAPSPSSSTTSAASRPSSATISSDSTSGAQPTGGLGRSDRGPLPPSARPPASPTTVCGPGGPP